MSGHTRVAIGRKMRHEDHVEEQLASERVYVLSKNDTVQIRKRKDYKG
jgi:hypothetical protein